MNDPRLRAIAACLGVPVSEFYERSRAGNRTDANECLHLWHRLRTDAGRAAALAALRRVLDTERS